MSGYRSLHRHRAIPDDENGQPGAVWGVATAPWLASSAHSSLSPPSRKFRLFVVGSADSDVRAYAVEESSLDQSGGGAPSAALGDGLDASAARFALTHLLTDSSGRRHRRRKGGAEAQAEEASSSLGCSRVCAVRNYVGDDDAAGNLAVVALDLVGRLRVWEIDASLDEKSPPAEPEEPQVFPARHEAVISEATGTTLALCRPPSEGPLCVAVGCLDGSVALVATGLVTPNYCGGASMAPPEIGTVLRTWGGRGSSVPLALGWKPDEASQLAVGRQDGTVDLLHVVWGGERDDSPSSSSSQRNHRLDQHSKPVRALAYTPDGALLLSGSDDGLLCVWDVSRVGVDTRTATRSVPLVHHITCGGGTGSWILQILALPDARRFVVATQSHQLQVWDLDHPHQVSHTFSTESPVYASVVVEAHQQQPSRTQQQRRKPRIVTGNDSGWVQLFSVE